MNLWPTPQRGLLLQYPILAGDHRLSKNIARGTTDPKTFWSKFLIKAEIICRKNFRHSFPLKPLPKWKPSANIFDSLTLTSRRFWTHQHGRTKTSEEPFCCCCWGLQWWTPFPSASEINLESTLWLEIYQGICVTSKSCFFLRNRCNTANLLHSLRVFGHCPIYVSHTNTHYRKGERGRVFCLDAKNHCTLPCTEGEPSKEIPRKSEGGEGGSHK